MKPLENTQNTVCGDIQALLSDYIDNTLSARQVWEVEKHLASCANCAAVSQEMQATVQLLHTAERYDTASDFMARLHARLDGLEPEAARRRFGLAVVRDWLAGAGETLRAKRVPALSLGMAMTALVAVALLNRPTPPTSEDTVRVPVNNPAPITETLQRNVALSASDPFGDPSAANLEAHSAIHEASAPQDSEGVVN